MITLEAENGGLDILFPLKPFKQESVPFIGDERTLDTRIVPGVTSEGTTVWVQTRYSSLPDNSPLQHPGGTVERSGITDKLEVVNRVVTGNRSEPCPTPAVKGGSFLDRSFNATLLPSASQMQF